MRSLLARLAVLGAFAVSMSACSGGTGSSLPFAGEPNSAGGTPGTIQTGSNGQALIRFVQGSPDVATVDICVDSLAFGVTGDTAAYGKAAQTGANNGATLVSVAGGIPHTISVFPTAAPAAGGPGAECPTAPGPYFGTSALAVTTISPGNNSRLTVVLGGTAASHTFGLYVFSEPSFAIAPAGNEVISHNAAPAFTAAQASKAVGFGTCSTTATPCATPANLAGANALAAGKIATVSSASTTAAVTSGLAAIPAGFYDGIGVTVGAVVPVTSVAAPTPAAGQPYIIDLYAIDGPAGGLNLVSIAEQTLGYGF